ncbi:integrator complex subunit 12 [Trichinella spiralis]|uniref:integrator complex subunit 12 n=1 Tax=Trichinella spiralis TaxID=6334 RepID=UPI0001EFD1F7|nr:integrator complex subunit 12 [Trichinella spiralis]
MIRWCNLQKRQMLKSSIFCLVVAAVPGSTPSAYEVKKLSHVTLSPFSLCCDGRFGDDAIMRHGDVTGVLELECRPSTVGGSVGVRGTPGICVVRESNGFVLRVCVLYSVDSVIVCEYQS